MSLNPLSIHPCFAHYSGIVAMREIRCGLVGEQLLNLLQLSRYAGTITGDAV
jgi:hypothetical protein